MPHKINSRSLPSRSRASVSEFDPIMQYYLLVDKQVLDNADVGLNRVGEGSSCGLHAVVDGALRRDGSYRSGTTLRLPFSFVAQRCGDAGASRSAHDSTNFWKPAMKSPKRRHPDRGRS